MNEDKVILKANLTLTKEEIIDRVVDQQMEPFEREYQSKNEEYQAAKKEWQTLRAAYDILLRTYENTPRSFLTDTQKAALDQYEAVFPDAKSRPGISEFGCSASGEFLLRRRSAADQGDCPGSSHVASGH